ncbi:Uncharacterised protein [Vibrio cholerae]|nr:Uncharacterised protein [Vibrio cholerae]
MTNLSLHRRHQRLIRAQRLIANLYRETAPL